jgi:mono/diheme cytochrome c family protein
MSGTIIRVGIALSLLGVVPGWAQQESKDVFLDKCSVCHGADGAGKTAKGRKLKVNDIHETLSKMGEAEMTKVVAEGKGKNMDGFSKELNAAQIKGVVEYYRSLGK